MTRLNDSLKGLANLIRKLKKDTSTPATDIEAIETDEPVFHFPTPPDISAKERRDLEMLLQYYRSLGYSNNMIQRMLSAEHGGGVRFATESLNILQDLVHRGILLDANTHEIKRRDQRRARRFHSVEVLRYRTVEPSDANYRIEDISKTGAKMQAGSHPMPSSRVILALSNHKAGGELEISGQVVWKTQNKFGLHFDHPIKSSLHEFLTP